jgi:hypothetical protein
MKTEKFFAQMMKEEMPNAGAFWVWLERKKYNLWLKLPCDNPEYRTNADFIKMSLIR